MNKLTMALACALIFSISSSVFAEQVPEPKRKDGKPWIQQISKNVWSYGDIVRGIFIPTSEGIILADGDHCDKRHHMEWLKQELDRRYDVPVKYVLLSHDHPSHICGTDVFKDTAIGIGHRNLLPHVIREQRPSLIPTVLFDNQLDIELGGVKVTALYPGWTHSDNLIQVYIPEDKVMFAPDMARGAGMYPDFRDMDVVNNIRTLYRYAHMPDLDIVIGGHSNPTTPKKAFLPIHDYLKTMHSKVLDYMTEGKTVTEIVDLVKMKEFDHFARWSPKMVEGNVVSMYYYLYRYREPNQAIQPWEEMKCRFEGECRTHNLAVPHKRRFH